MKILRLDLFSFGHFKDFTLEFPESGPGFHLIVGPNEAGKTTTLHALKCLLHGFENVKGSEFPDENYKNDYDFVPNAPKQKLGATLLNSAGERLRIVRSKAKGKAKQLLAADEKTEIDAATIKRFLPNPTKTPNQGLYLATHAELVELSKKVIGGASDSDTLFFAGAGLEPFTRVLQSLREKADTLFKEQAKNPVINALFLELEKARKQAKDLALSAKKWNDETEKLNQAEAESQALEREIEGVEEEARRLDRLQAAQPALTRRAEAMQRLAALGDVPRLRVDLATEFSKAESGQDTAADEVTSLTATLNDLTLKIETATNHEHFLAHADAIETLQKQLSVYRKTLAECKDKQPKLAALEASVRRDLGAIHPDLPLEQIPSLKPSDDRLNAIRTLGRSQSALDEACRNADSNLATLMSGQEESAAEPASDSNTRAILDELAAFVAKIREKGDLDDQWHKAIATFEKSQAKHAKLLKALPLWDRSFDDLIAAKIPPNATISRFKSDWDQNIAGRQEYERMLGELTQQRLAIEKNIADDQLRGAVPSEADLDQARKARDLAWSQIKRAWIKGEPVESASRLAQEFDRLLTDADTQADAIKREATRVHQRAQWLLDCHALIERQGMAEEHLSQSVAESEQLWAAWIEVWKPCGIKPLPPHEMADWLNERSKLLTKWEPVERDQAAAHELRAQIDAAIGDLRSLFSRLSEPAPTVDNRLSSWVAKAQRLIDQGTHADRLSQARLLVRQAAEAHARWQKNWDDAIAPLGLPPASSADAVELKISYLNTLTTDWAKLTELRSRVHELEIEITTFVTETREVAVVVGIDPADREPGELVKTLAGRAKEAREIEDQRIKTHAALETARARRERLAEQVHTLCREASCTTVEALKEAIRLSAEARELDAMIGAEERALREIRGVKSIEEVERETAQENFETLPERLGDLKAKVAAARSKLTRLSEVKGESNLLLTQMKAGSGATGAFEEIQKIIGGLEDKVSEYARIRLAEAVLRKAVDRYREKNQGPILERTNKLFHALTCGSFREITPLDEVVEPSRKVSLLPRLQGMRSGSNMEAVGVNGMSRGTADSLYLAIRLATLEHHLDSHEPMPFVVDDILVQLDDSRSQAALRSLGELATRTQVLFFTHHQHLVELARSALGSAGVSVHNLPARMNAIENTNRMSGSPAH